MVFRVRVLDLGGLGMPECLRTSAPGTRSSIHRVRQRLPPSWPKSCDHLRVGRHARGSPSHRPCFGRRHDARGDGGSPWPGDGIQLQPSYCCWRVDAPVKKTAGKERKALLQPPLTPDDGPAVAGIDRGPSRPSCPAVRVRFLPQARLPRLRSDEDHRNLAGAHFP